MQKIDSIATVYLSLIHIYIVNGGNFGLVMNAFDFLNGTESTGRTKSIGADEYLNITQSKAVVIMLVSVIVIPLIILLVGFTVFIRRRNK